MHYELLMPRHWVSWIGLGVLRLFAFLPYPAMLFAGRLIGKLARHLPLRYARVARRNMELCLPELSPRERENLINLHFANLGMGVCESAMCWWSPDERIRALSSVEGCEHLDRALQAGRGVILLTAHFTTIEISARIMNANRPICALYRPLKNAVLAAASNRNRIMRARSAIRHDDIRGMVRALRNNEIVWYAPDQSFRKKGAQMVRFFGVPAATNTGTSRLAQMTGATVLYFSHERLPNGGGYRVVIHPPNALIPSNDAIADTEHYNRFIEAQVRRIPDQYWWIHKRFKGLQAGYPNFYGTKPNDAAVASASASAASGSMAQSKDAAPVDRASAVAAARGSV
ncbi:MAG TPA: LpxL/LpxP family Kdo(2)-lipid IV(A) lauroyl/palmitoleoyl acyltransferase [Steroidobacteraceae bacterium]|jgi:KDO2-lipid IV(A) lauroyltransferase|nr:LpxL/LpxP family Kdo(2)-lipid IV(A) lauroyl/palmitoleoyl acyltransferase [Steroidobacteraceae bacterium]